MRLHLFAGNASLRRSLALAVPLQDGLVFRFASDVNADQTTEIDRMTRMLAALSPGERSQ